MATTQLSPPLRPIDRIAGAAVTLVTLTLFLTTLIVALMAALSA